TSWPGSSSWPCWLTRRWRSASLKLRQPPCCTRGVPALFAGPRRIARLAFSTWIARGVSAPTPRSCSASAAPFTTGSPWGAWRLLTAEEMPLLISDPEQDPEKDPEAGCLFQIPGHLRAAWWDLLDRSVAAGDAALPGFEDFTRQVAAFLKFKQMEVPPSLR